MSEELCSDCPPVGYPTDGTRCLPCPRRASAMTHETMPGAERAKRTSEHIPTPEGRGGEELKPCPLCGATILPHDDDLGGSVHPEGDCMFSNWTIDESEYGHWNRRSPLLSSPRVEEVRREALEEAAKWIELVGRDWKADGQHEKRFAADYLAAGIRALSPPVG